MTCVDTTVLIDFFAGRELPHVARFEALIAQREDLCLCGVILTEVLQSIKADSEYAQVEAILATFLFLPMTWETFRLAAILSRSLRAQGITIRNSVDCMIAAVCIEHQTRIFAEDVGCPLPGGSMPRGPLERIRAKIRQRHYDLSAHAMAEMAEEWLDIEDVEQALLQGQMTRIDRDDPRGTKYVIEGLGVDQRTLIGVVGRLTTTARYLIITVYERTDQEEER